MIIEYCVLKETDDKDKETVAPVATLEIPENTFPVGNAGDRRGVCRIVCIIPNEMQLTHSCWDVGIWIVPLSLNNRLANAGTPCFCCGRETYKCAFPPARVYQHMWVSNRVESRLWKCHSTEKQSYLAVAGSSPLPSILSNPLHPSVFVLDLGAFAIPSVETSLNLSQLEHMLFFCCCFFCKEHSIMRTHSFYLMSKERLCNKGTKAAERHSELSQDKS